MLSFLNQYIPDSAKQLAKGFIGADVQTEENYRPETINVLRQAAQNALQKGRTNIDYEDYPKINEDLSARDLVSDSEARGGFSNLMQLVATNPVADAAFTIGGGTLKVEDGEVFLTDVYDFNKIAPGKIKDLYGAIRYAAGQLSPERPNQVRIRLGSEAELLGYKVKKGDSLSKIADQLGTTVEELQAYNNIKNPNRISVGQRIKKPPTTAAQPEELVASADLLDGDSDLFRGDIGA